MVIPLVFIHCGGPVQGAESARRRNYPGTSKPPKTCSAQAAEHAASAGRHADKPLPPRASARDRREQSFRPHAVIGRENLAAASSISTAARGRARTQQSSPDGCALDHEAMHDRTWSATAAGGSRWSGPSARPSASPIAFSRCAIASLLADTVQRPVTRPDPPFNGSFAEPRLREMMGDHLRLGLGRCLEAIAQGLGNAPVQHLPAALEQVLVGRPPAPARA